MNNTEKLAQRGAKVVMNTYSRFPIAFDHGQGVYVWDMDGKKYLDFVAGIAVNSLGYSHPKLCAKIAEQSRNLCTFQTFTIQSHRLLLPKNFANTAALTKFFSATAVPSL